MAQHDYINKKPGGKKAAKGKVAKPFPKFFAALTLVLIGAFGYGLWYIKQHGEPEAQPISPMPAKKTEQPKAEKDLPRPPDFIKDIKDHEVKVEVKKIESQGPYQMQCGSFRTYEQAEQMKAKMAFAGLIAEIRRTEGSNGVWYRVRLGPYDTKRGAESDKNKLERINIVSCGIWKWT
ncbi:MULTISPECIES: SPOR domain-containing protein [Pseudoalteromonas]|uniref:SPOR domain-containing protein n=1 Tax=Pseudoalteromonas rubra TaxID=43658 RepID=A0A5S3UZ10_9GAMM|nr:MULTISPECIES: SPOR domain-containing protein [Pseudoalteromonas]MCG7562179.1 SPOR domain-containing protein [Pseudoalteromonas sp. McH1-42]MEC4091210.1 SPOR domain-containing protein [Pseudoalteromonas rubra]QPB81657.1 SPOR domain-containing protein [Pseudoalteromonas rubra]